MNYRDIKSLKEQVKAILEAHINARNDDAALIEIVCREWGYAVVEKASSIERCRRYWQSSGKYLPTYERVVKQRKMNVDEWRVAMGYPIEASAGTAKPSWTPPSEVKKQQTLL